MGEYEENIGNSSNMQIIKVVSENIKSTPDVDISSEELNEYQKDVIEFDSLARRLDLLVATWSEIKNQNLPDEVENIRVTKAFTKKLLELIKQI